MARALFTSLVLVAAGCAASAAPNVCEQAAAVVADCTGEAAATVPTCTADAAADAEVVVALGCDAAGKDDLATALCIGPLRNILPWCEAAEYECSADDRALDPSLCNGDAALCARRYDQVVYATSHNAFSAATMGFIRPNQSERMYEQLEDGMRALMLDGHMHDGELSLCHVDCRLGRQSFADGLREVRDFLECHPREVVTLIIEPHAAGSLHADAIIDSGLDAFAYTHTAGAPWPTLGEMIDRDHRLVILAEEPGVGTPDWYHYQWDHAFDTDYSVERAADFACELERGQTDNSLFGLNHFVTLLGGDELLAVDPNESDNIASHVARCEAEFGRLPNYLAVDFHDVGDVVETVRALNARD